MPALNVRLTTPLTSYDAGATVQFSSLVIAPYLKDGVVKLPAGTIVRGVVKKTKRVGLGLIRERAALELEFREYELPDGRRYPLQAVLRSIDNARESVNKNGQIQGILAANGPQSLIGGVWHLPDFDRFSRSFIGLTGAGGRIVTQYSMGPFGAAAIFAARCLIFRLPEPEIQLTAGTEMYVRVTELPADAPSFEPQAPIPVPKDLAEWLAALPVATVKAKGPQAADIINVALIGSRVDVVDAFRAAGWVEAETLTPRSFSRAYKAYSAQRGYAAAPVSKLLYRDSEPELVFQKSFNTISKRHHIRLWQAEYEGQPVWLAAATHDVGVRYESGLKVTHQIQPQIDLERSKVIDDLGFTGCLNAPGFVERADAMRTKGDNGVISDGRLAVLFLRDCSHTVPAVDIPAPPRTQVARFARRMILEGRQYILRGNAYYWGYRVMAFRHTKNQAPQIGSDE